MITDPIADFLTRIRNASRVNHRWVEIPASKLKVRIAHLLRKEGFIKDMILVDDGKQGILRLYLKYQKDGIPVILDLQRVSSPGRRVYVAHSSIPRVRNGLGVGILSTSQGVITDKEARRRKLGGEYLCKVW